MNHQLPDWECKHGHSEIIKDKLYICGEDDVDDLLYGYEESRNINSKGYFIQSPNPQVDVWIDLRDIRESNRKVFIPDSVEYIQIPFRDGVLIEAVKHLPIAKKILEEKMSQNKRVIVSCFQGRSRSVTLVLWYLCEQLNSYLDAYWAIKSKRPIMEPDKNFRPLLEEWKNKYPPQNNLTIHN
jgi:protein-tyrosine phosphatase